ncbi:hypothetical protein AB0L10_44145 [Streptomyces flaveolus]|uniref:hypothetical protein n=1 Tax=Streptomyces flaveolus TaxID=67297 RepID=UPI00342F059A
MFQAYAAVASKSRRNGDGERMTTMQNWGLTWTDTDGRAQASAVAYDRVSGERRKAAREASGSTDVRFVPVEPGVLPQSQA